MITKETLIQYSKIMGLKPWKQEKHYIQSLILLSISEKPIVFKGGTYLWFFHGLDRFSEDLDFTAEEECSSELMKETSKTLELLGVENKTTIISNNERSFSFRVGARGPLNTSEKDVCYVYVEISKREKVLLRPISLTLDAPAYNIPTKIIRGMDLNEVAAEKVRAIISRKKARDVYDLSFLVDKGVRFNVELINKKLSYYSLSFSSSDFEEGLSEKEEYWKQELEPLVEILPKFDVTKEKILIWAKM